MCMFPPKVFCVHQFFLRSFVLIQKKTFVHLLFTYVHQRLCGHTKWMAQSTLTSATWIHKFYKSTLLTQCGIQAEWDMHLLHFATAVLHTEMSLIHTDLKPENILLVEGGYTHEGRRRVPHRLTFYGAILHQCHFPISVLLVLGFLCVLHTFCYITFLLLALSGQNLLLTFMGVQFMWHKGAWPGFGLGVGKYVRIFLADATSLGFADEGERLPVSKKLQHPDHRFWRRHRWGPFWHQHCFYTTLQSPWGDCRCVHFVFLFEKNFCLSPEPEREPSALALCIKLRVQWLWVGLARSAQRPLQVADRPRPTLNYRITLLFFVI